MASQILIYEPTWRPIQAEIAQRAPDLELLLMDEWGRITLNGATVEPESARPAAAWLNHEVFLSPVSRDFIVTLLKSPNLLWVQSAAAGFDHPVFSQLAAKGATLTISHGQAPGMADYVLAGVLDHFQRGPERRAAQASRSWKLVASREIGGSRWLIVGFGAIGQAVAERALAFGATVTGVRRDQTPHALAERIVPLSGMEDDLRSADVVVLATPLNPATRHLADGRFFANMKAASVLVNVGRGGLVDEPALLAALERGAPAHAVLDVFETEPLSSDSPFWAHPRVSLTAHCSGVSSGQRARNTSIFLENLSRFAAGEPLLNIVSAKDLSAP